MIVAKVLKGVVRDRIDRLRPQQSDDRPRAALIFGAGALPGIGAAVAQRIASGGMMVYLAGRNADKLATSVEAITQQGGKAQAITVDVADEQQIASAFAKLDADGYCLDLVVHNVGTNRPKDFLDITPELLERSWRADCLSGFWVGQQAVAQMQARGHGTILFTGASASLRGKAGFAVFAAAKAGLRSLAQAMAREYGPKGIHVAHVVIDGMVDSQRLRAAAPQLLDGQGEGRALDPEAIAETYWGLYTQHKSTWTHELDLRPCNENW